MTNTNETKLFLVFETLLLEGHNIDENVTKAFHARDAAESYVAELEAKEDRPCKKRYRGMTEWAIKEIALG
jgi:hypothetical protein